MFEVVYYSLTGNTKKVAEAIAAELDVVAENVKSKSTLDEESTVFLGAGLYGPLRSWGFRRFIDRNRFDGRKVALFGTSGGQGKGSWSSRRSGSREGRRDRGQVLLQRQVSLRQPDTPLE